MHPSFVRALPASIAAGLLLLACADETPTRESPREAVPAGASASLIQPTCSGTPSLCSAWDSELVPNFPNEVAIHMHLLPTGEVLFWPGEEGLGRGKKHSQYAFLWNPATGAFRQVDNNRTDVFCSGHALLPNGNLLVAGGHLGDDVGSADVNIFNPTKRSWSRAQGMGRGRWYPTVTTLADGRALVLAGRDENRAYNPLVQVFNPAGGGKWTTIGSRSFDYPYYPFVFQAPNGRVFYAGPEQQSLWLDPATGAWTNAFTSGVPWRDYGSAVMYDVGKVMIAGGGGDWRGGQGPHASAEVIDLNTGGGWTATGAMNYPRRQFNLTVLPDGKVLATGGTSGAGHNNEWAAVQMAEIWDPATGGWRALTAEAKPRTYHGLALLLPDGRVISAGSGRCGGCMYDQTNAQLFSPPYLFNGDGSLATRPTITSAPGSARYGAGIAIGTPDAAAIQRVTLVRLGSVTHGFDQNQRFVPLQISGRTGTSVTALAPARPELAPPGHYMLFILNGQGTPSVAKIIQLQ